jgi:PleD family two-component response regulator
LLALLPFISLASELILYSNAPLHHLERPLTTLDFYQNENYRQQAARLNEHHRKTVMLPYDAFAPSDALAAAARARQGIVDKPAPEPELADPQSILEELFAGVVVVTVLALFRRKIAKTWVAYTNDLVLPKLGRYSRLAGRANALLAEEKAVLEFVATMHPGVRANNPDALLASTMPLAELEERTMFATALGLIREIRRLLEESKASDVETARRKSLLEMRDRIHPLKVLASKPQLLPLGQMTRALEMLLKQLTEKQSNVTASTLRTMTLGVNLLEELCRPGLKPDLMSEPPLRMLVVDDETFSRYALSTTLKRAFNEPELAVDGVSALALAVKQSYDLIFLDVMMPGMDGFELCSRIRETDANRNTPVVFVSSLTDFDSRSKSIVCGGRDMIAKPFLTFEVIVKALTLVAQERLRGNGRKADAPAEAAPVAAVPAVAEEPAKAAVGKVARSESINPQCDEKDQVSGNATVPVAVSRVSRDTFPSEAHGKEEKAPTVAVSSCPPAPAPRKPARSFFAYAEAQTKGLLELAGKLPGETDPDAQLNILTHLYLRANSLAENAGHSKQHNIAGVASSLEGLLKKLREKTSNRSASALETVVNAVKLISDLCNPKLRPDLCSVPPIRVLAVDDNPIALRAIINALQMKFVKPEKAPDGETALEMASENLFDVIFMDVQMPGIDGFEACKAIRESTINRKTPVVFVTSCDDAATREKAKTSGGNDFITKPFLVSEVTLQTLIFAIRGRMETKEEARVPEADPAPATKPAPGKVECVEVAVV